jgi:biopolymer transport protein ExbB
VQSPLEAFLAVRDFLEMGGPVLLPIMAVTFLMWTLIVERYWYFYRQHPAYAREIISSWQKRSDRSSWYAQQIRTLDTSLVAERLQQFSMTVKTLVALCPLLGLLGTVTGMIEVFDIMAITGSANPRAMASGVAKATIPTMAGMVAALSGLYFSVRIERFAREETKRVADQLTHA